MVNTESQRLRLEEKKKDGNKEHFETRRVKCSITHNEQLVCAVHAAVFCSTSGFPVDR